MGDETKVKQEPKPELDTKEEEPKKLDSKLKDMAHNVAEKLLDNPAVKERVNDIIVTKDPEEKAEKVKSLKDAIHHAVHGAMLAKKKKDEKTDKQEEVKVEKDVKKENELNPELKDMAHKVATKLMDNAIIHNHLVEILQEDDPSVKD